LKITDQIVIAGIGTAVGKTLVSAIVTQALHATYWKPIQTGYQDGKGDRDADFIREWTDCPVIPETYLLQEPLSPHIAAKLDGIAIDPDRLDIPTIAGPLVIETAGGLMVPLNDSTVFADILQRWQKPVVLVVRQYLGNINHTLLSVEALRSRNIPVLGIISNGNPLPDTNEWVSAYTRLPFLLHIPNLERMDRQVLSDLASTFKNNLNQYGLE